MGLRGWIKRLERDSREELVTIKQQDGTVARFPVSALAEAFANSFERMGAGEDAPPEHPLVAAARNSSEPKWSQSLFAASGEGWTDPVEDLSE